MLACNGFLGLLLGDFVGLATYHGDELDAALNKQIARISGESDAIVGFGSKYLGDDFGDGRFWKGEVIGAYVRDSVR